jgi:hypothetical protein
MVNAQADALGFDSQLSIGGSTRNGKACGAKSVQWANCWGTHAEISSGHHLQQSRKPLSALPALQR